MSTDHPCHDAPVIAKTSADAIPQLQTAQQQLHPTFCSSARKQTCIGLEQGPSTSSKGVHLSFKCVAKGLQASQIHTHLGMKLNSVAPRVIARIRLAQHLNGADGLPSQSAIEL
eukprot:6174587-Pleurochrysis_carterae.AAC.2